MAQFNALKELVAKEKIKSANWTAIYSHRMHFRIELRSKYATWIESKEWPSISDSTRNSEEWEQRYQEFVDILQNDFEQMSPAVDMVEKVGFKTIVDEFVERYQYSSAEFVKVVSNILRTEKTLILSAKEPNNPDEDDHRRFSIAQENPQIMQAISSLRSTLRSTELGLTSLEEMQEKYLLEINEIREKMNQQKKQLDKDPEAKQRLEKLDKEYNECIRKLHQQRQSTMNALYQACSELAKVLKNVWDELEEWRNDQRLACTMLKKPKEQIMEVLDHMGESIGEVFMQVLQQIDKLVNLLERVQFQNDTVLSNVKDKLKPEMMQFLEVHLDKVFVVDKNIPKQVLKVTNGKSLGFSMSVRFLGGYAFGLSVNQPKVSVKLYPEKQIKEIMAAKAKNIDGCCKIQNAQDKAFEFLRNGSCMANFNNMVVSNVKREGRGRNDDFVTDYKHAFVFMTTVKILMGYCQTTAEFPLKALSLPLVITSQTSQECMARGTIIWSAAFPKVPEVRSVL